MSFSTGCRKCQKCGKMYLMNLFDGGLCAECEKTEQENMPCITPEEMQKCKDIVKKYTPEQEPCDDAVSRQEVLDLLVKYDNDMEFDVYSEIFDSIDKLPSVRPQEQTGEWIALESRFELGDRLKCSECGQVFVVGDDVSRKYCPNCGARMESEDKE